METTKNRDFRYVLPGIKEAKNYVPPTFEKGICGLYMNYSMYGPSPKCKEVLNNIEIDRFKEYPYGGNQIISHAIANAIGVSEHKVIVDNGAASILELVFRMVLKEEDTILFPDPGWDYYRSLSNIIGAKCMQYPLYDAQTSYRYHQENIQNGINQAAPKLVVITSPNMPTGNKIEQVDLEQILQNNPNVLVLIDEAYFGYSNTTLDIDKLTTEYHNVVFVRTLSKLYGLASERIGFAIANPGFIELAKKLTPLFGISYTSQLLAKAAVEDVSYYEEVSKMTISQRERLADTLNQMGHYSVYESSSNFILVKVKDYDSNDIVTYIHQNGYAIRECGKGYNLKQHIRISIGTKEMVSDLIHLFEEYEKIKNQSHIKLAQISHDDDHSFDF